MDMSMDFVTGLSISAYWKGDSYDSILVIVDRLTKMIYYEPVKITIDALGLAKVIINVVVYHYKVLESIIIDWSLLFTSKFWSSLYYCLEIKKMLSIAIFSQIDGQTKNHDSTIEVYLRAFVN